MELPPRARSLVLSAATIAGMISQPAAEQPGQQRTDSPAARPSEAAPGSVLNPRLDEQRQVLAPLEGRWTVRVERPEPGRAPGPAMLGNQEITTAERVWVLNRKFLQEVQTSEAAPEGGLAYLGFDEATGLFSLIRLEPTGRATVQLGRWNSSTRSIVFRSNPGSGPVRDGSESAGPTPAAAVLRITGDQEHVIEVYRRAQPDASPIGREPARGPDSTAVSPETEESDDNGSEIDAAPPGRAKLPSMLPPDGPGSTEPAPGDADIDPENLLYRIFYTRVGAEPGEQGIEHPEADQ